MAPDSYRRADPNGVIARFATSAAIGRSPEGTYLAWRWSLRDGLDPAVAAAIVLEAGAGRWRRPAQRRLRRLLECTRRFALLPVNDNAHLEEG